MNKIFTFFQLCFVLVSFNCLADKDKTIYLISSSSAYEESVIPKISNVLKEKGFSVDTKYLNQQISDFGYVNTDKERAKNLINALTDDNVKYLWFVRGGSGAFNLMPYLYAQKEDIRKHRQKIIIGFSDVTAIHYFINNYIGWKSVHGIVAGYNKDMYDSNAVDKLSMNNGFDQVLASLEKGISYNGIIPMNASALLGTSGLLSGGNLTLLQSFFSTVYEKKTDNQILLMEDIGVTYKQLDRSLNQILHKRNFKPKAIIFGQFYTITASDEERLIFKTVIKEFADKTKIPVYYYPYFGHGKTNNPYILNAKVRIECEKNEEYCQLKQSGVRIKNNDSNSGGG